MKKFNSSDKYKKFLQAKKIRIILLLWILSVSGFFTYLSQINSISVKAYENQLVAGF